MKLLLIALALTLAPLRAHADGPPAKGLGVFEGEPGDKKFVDASSSGGLGDQVLAEVGNPECVFTPVLEGGAGVQLASRAEKLVLLGSAKGGATVTAKLALEHWGRTAAWQKYDPWVHQYRGQVFYKEPDHRQVNLSAVARDPEWLIVFFVRNPLDRAISSYIHVMRCLKAIGWIVRDTSPQTSFVQFLSALERNYPDNDRTGGHASPQSVASFDTASNVVYVPIETLDLGILEAFARLYPRVQPPFNYSTPGTNTSGHYVKQSSESTAARPRDMSRVPWQHLPGSHRSFPSYDQFYLNPAVKAKVMCLFAQDVALYRRACDQAWRLGPAIAAKCAAEVMRFD
jgi:hypothetical protein